MLDHPHDRCVDLVEARWPLTLLDLHHVKANRGVISSHRRPTLPDLQVEAIRQIGVSEVTYYRWRQEFGGLKIEQVKRLKDLELENSRLRKAVSDLTLDKLILQEAARGNF